MKIASAEPEGAHGGPAGVFRVRHPRFGGLINVEGAVFTQNLGGCCHFDGGGQHFMMEGQGRLYQSGSAGCGLGMTDLGFHGADGAPWRLYAVFEHLGNGFDLHRVAYFCSGTVGFQQGDGGRVHIRQSIGLFYGFDLA